MSAPVRIAIGGALGRMGRALIRIIEEDPQAALSGAWDRPGNPSIGQALAVLGLGAAAPLALSPDPASAIQGDSPAQVAIEFALPGSTGATLKAVLASPGGPLPLVIGTTGFDAAQIAAIHEASAKAPIVMASNYSVGMNILWQVLKDVAAVTGDAYDVEVIEAHHNQKKDSPSGTAMTTAEVLAKALGRDLGQVARYGRAKGNIGARGAQEIGIHTVRGGDIVGDHTVLFAGPGERLEFKHQAHSRDNFALGAIRAAKWLVQQKKGPGLYSMAEVLGLKR